jgi:hypothetical protein
MPGVYNALERRKARGSESLPAKGLPCRPRGGAIGPAGSDFPSGPGGIQSHVGRWQGHIVERLMARAFSLAPPWPGGCWAGL